MLVSIIDILAFDHHSTTAIIHNSRGPSRRWTQIRWILDIAILSSTSPSPVDAVVYSVTHIVIDLAHNICESRVQSSAQILIL